MDDCQRNVGDIVAALLAFCCSGEHRAALEASAEERSISFEQLVAAAIAQALSDEFVIVPHNGGQSREACLIPAAKHSRSRS